jgi:Putative prokaryotic signal transducing protein
MDAPLVCPACGTGGGLSDRFCPRCGSPFIYAPGLAGPRSPRDDAASARARKIHPPYAEGEPVRVARAQNQPEAELLQGLLLEEGIPSLVRRSGGFDVPDFLAAGPRDVLVPRGGEAAARELLGTPPVAVQRAPGRLWVRTLAFVLAVLVLALVAAGVLSAILR